CGSSLSSSSVSRNGSSTSPSTLKSQVARSISSTEPACSTGHFSVRYCPGGSRAGSYPASSTFRSALDLNTASSLGGVQTVTRAPVRRPRAYVRVAGPDASDLLQRLVSNDVVAGESCEALL